MVDRPWPGPGANVQRELITVVVAAVGAGLESDVTLALGVRSGPEDHPEPRILPACQGSEIHGQPEALLQVGDVLARRMGIAAGMHAAPTPTDRLRGLDQEGGGGPITRPGREIEAEMLPADRSHPLPALQGVCQIARALLPRPARQRDRVVEVLAHLLLDQLCDHLEIRMSGEVGGVADGPLDEIGEEVRILGRHLVPIGAVGVRMEQTLDIGEGSDVRLGGLLPGVADGLAGLLAPETGRIDMVTVGLLAAKAAVSVRPGGDVVMDQFVQRRDECLLDDSLRPDPLLRRQGGQQPMPCPVPGRTDQVGPVAARDHAHLELVVVRPAPASGPADHGPQGPLPVVQGEIPAVVVMLGPTRHELDQKIAPAGLTGL